MQCNSEGQVNNKVELLETNMAFLAIRQHFQPMSLLIKRSIPLSSVKNREQNCRFNIIESER